MTVTLASEILLGEVIYPVSHHNDNYINQLEIPKTSILASEISPKPAILVNEIAQGQLY